MCVDRPNKDDIENLCQNTWTQKEVEGHLSLEKKKSYIYVSRASIKTDLFHNLVDQALRSFIWSLWADILN